MNDESPNTALVPTAQNEVDTEQTTAPIVDITPRFKLVFATVAGLTVLSLVLNLILVIVGTQGAQATSLADTCSTAFKLGFGAIVGLVSAKVV